MPTNLYGPGDNYHAKNSHVIPGLIRRFHEAKIANQEQVVIWGTGKVLREFLHVDDLASAAVHVMDLPKDIYESKTLPTNSHLNVGSGVEISIAELANLIASKIGYDGKIIFDTEMPEGPARKLLDSSKITQMGWSAKIEIAEGLSATYKEYLNSIGNTIIED
jgi:GDP-L-fucose synthase